MSSLANVLAELESIEVSEFEYKAFPPKNKLFASLGIEKLTRICKQLLSNHSSDSWAEALFRTIERLDDHVDLGSPGILVHTLEKIQPGSDYELYLHQSIQRKPTELTLWMISRIVSVPDRFDRKKWFEILKTVEHNPNSSSDTKQFAEDFVFDYEEDFPFDQK